MTNDQKVVSPVGGHGRIRSPVSRALLCVVAGRRQEEQQERKYQLVRAR